MEAMLQMALYIEYRTKCTALHIIDGLCRSGGSLYVSESLTCCVPVLILEVPGAPCGWECVWGREGEGGGAEGDKGSEGRVDVHGTGSPQGR